MRVAQPVCISVVSCDECCHTRPAAPLTHRRQLLLLHHQLEAVPSGAQAGAAPHRHPTAGATTACGSTRGEVSHQCTAQERRGGEASVGDRSCRYAASSLGPAAQRRTATAHEQQAAPQRTECITPPGALLFLFNSSSLTTSAPRGTSLPPPSARTAAAGRAQTCAQQTGCLLASAAHGV